MERTFSHYRVLKLLGKGAMGEVYLAEDTRLKRSVALKVLLGHLREDPESFRRFKIEAEAVARLNHPHIATLYTVEVVDDQWVIAMEYIEGDPLKNRIPKKGLDLNLFFDWFPPLAEALAHAHERNVTHRDIKPGNIVITRENIPKILDFGLARIHRGGEGDTGTTAGEGNLTQIGTIMGSPAYMSPEQAVGTQTDHRTDIFSLGIVMYEALTGEKPFKGRTIQEHISSILKDQPVAVTSIKPGIPYLLAHIIGKALQKDLRKRYQTVQDIVNDLRAAKLAWENQQTTGDSNGVNLTGSNRSPRGRTPGFRLQAWLGICFILVGAVFGWFLPREKPRTVEPDSRLYRIPLEGVSSSVTGGGAAISPDGRMIAFVQEEKLCLMDLATGRSVQVPDAVTVEQLPFWSPDSRQVGYLTDMGRTIRKVSKTAGQSQTLCDVSALGFVGSATWGSRGDIVFDIWGGDWTRGLGLLKVSHDGGLPEPLLPPDTVKGETYQSPYFLPDGRGLLYVMVRPDGPSELMVRSNGMNRSLVKCVEGRIFYPIYSASGYLLYQKGLASDYGIWAVPFSLDRLETTGDSFPVAENGAWPSVSEDGTLTYTSEPPFKQQLVWLKRNGQVLSTVGPGLAGTQIGAIALSPDQTRVAMDAFETNYEDIWLMDISRGTRTRLTFSPARDAEAAWSPDGGQLAYTSERQGMSDLFVQTVDPGAKAKPVVQGGSDKFNSHWSINGRFLAYEMITLKTKRDIWYHPLHPGDRQSAQGANGQPTLFLQTPFDEAMPQISPDGRHIAYMSNISGRWEVYVRPFPDEAGEWQISVRGGGYPRWSSRGDELFYVEGDALMSTRVRAQPIFRFEVPEKLFEWKHLGIYFTRRFDPSSDALLFLAVQETSQDKRFMNIMEHWHRAFATK
ncbi:MAG: protein kinase [Pseudomonadota bacterium]